MSDEPPKLRMFTAPVAVKVPEYALEDVRDQLEQYDDVTERDVKNHLLDRVGFKPLFRTTEGEDAVEVLLEK